MYHEKKTKNTASFLREGSRRKESSAVWSKKLHLVIGMQERHHHDYAAECRLTGGGEDDGADSTFCYHPPLHIGNPLF